MNKAQALAEFWGGFGVLAFEESSVPDSDTILSMIKAGQADSEFPRITYSVTMDSFGNTQGLTANVYDRNTSWERADRLAQAIAEKVDATGLIPIDDGAMWIERGSPWASHVADEDYIVKHIALNITVEYLTAS